MASPQNTIPVFFYSDLVALSYDERKEIALDILLAHVHKNAGPHGCWLWIRQCFSGYGRCWAFKKLGFSMRVHRTSYELFHGPIPAGLEIAHTCDTKACANPAHLEAWSHTQNIQDALKKGLLDNSRFRGNAHWSHRHPEWVKRGDDHWVHTKPESYRRGDAHPNTKLTRAIVRDAQERYAQGVRIKDLAEEFGVHRKTMARAIRSKS